MSDNERLLALIGGDPNAMITLSVNNNKTTTGPNNRMHFNRDGGLFAITPSAKAMEPPTTQSISSVTHTFES